MKPRKTIQPAARRPPPASPAGFSLIEVILVVAIMGIVSLMAAPFFGQVLGSNDLKSVSDGASDALREAQSSAMSGKSPGKYGVHFEAGQYVVFQGAAYSAVDPLNSVRPLSARVRFTSVALSPGGACTVATGAGNCDIHFVNHRGVPTENGTIVMTADDGAIKTLTINAAGMVDVN